MDVKFINPFLDGTVSVLKTMAFVEPTAGKPYLKKDNSARGDVSAIIGLTGDAIGSLALSFSEGAILKIVSNMLGEEIKAINRDIKDAVGEILNIVSGQARKKLESTGRILKGAIPTVIAGKNHTITHITKDTIIAVPFKTQNGDFTIEVCIED